MGDGHRRQPGSWLVIVIAAASLLCGCQTSMSDIFDMDGPDRGTQRETSATLPLGSWTRDRLHCDQGLCDRWYEIEVDDGGMLRVDVYAPVGDGLPDCEMSLETEDGEVLEARTGRVQAQRRLRYSADPGTYRLRLSAKGPSQDVFDYEVVAEVRPDATPRPKTEPRPKVVTPPTPRPEIPIAKMPDAPEPTPAEPVEVEEESASIDEVPAPPEPEPEPEPEPVWVVAEVLDVEESGGRPAAVMLEAGKPDGIDAGMQGELFEGDTVIGRIEVVDVYPTGSRAKILGELSRPVSFDTYSRIEISSGK